MTILAIKLYEATFGVYALASGEVGQNCPTHDFLHELERNKSLDFGQITRYLFWSKDRHITNPDQFKNIGGGLFEFRGFHGARLFCFRDGRELLLCANGYVKKKNSLNASELETARAWRTEYFAAKENGTLIFKDE